MATHRRGAVQTMVVAGSVYFLMKKREKIVGALAQKDIAREPDHVFH
jgi:hypothetical protein